jgi:hypothetical protein
MMKTFMHKAGGNASLFHWLFSYHFFRGKGGVRIPVEKHYSQK